MPQWQLLHRSDELYPSEVISLEMADARALKQLGWDKAFDWEEYFKPSSLSDA